MRKTRSNINRYLATLRMTQGDLARELQMAESRLSRIILGQTEPGVLTANRIARILTRLLLARNRSTQPVSPLDLWFDPYAP